MTDDTKHAAPTPDTAPTQPALIVNRQVNLEQQQIDADQLPHFLDHGWHPVATLDAPVLVGKGDQRKQIDADQVTQHLASGWLVIANVARSDA